MRKMLITSAWLMVAPITAALAPASAQSFSTPITQQCLNEGNAAAQNAYPGASAAADMETWNKYTAVRNAAIADCMAQYQGNDPIELHPGVTTLPGKGGNPFDCPGNGCYTDY